MLFRDGTVAHPRTVRILGTHGVPAAYGGFETAAENVGLHLLRSGWRVIIYCQVDGHGPITRNNWQGIERVNIPVALPGWRGTSLFDLRASLHAAQHRDPCLLFGYNTAIFNVIQRFRRTPLVINMDGMEWTRKRWGPARQAILYTNERIASKIGHEIIADHPRIEDYLKSHANPCKVTMIPYGADAVVSAPTAPVHALNLEPSNYFTLICRPIPENSILEIVQGFSACPRGAKLVILGNYEPDLDPYHRAVVDAASPEVVFPGAIYDPEVTRALRFHSLGYLHGHTVGGTNPSLVEAMAAGNPVIAHDNAYNRWVAGDGALYFKTDEDVHRLVDQLLGSTRLQRELGRNSRNRHAAHFTWELIARDYERLLEKHVNAGADRASAPWARSQA